MKLFKTKLSKLSKLYQLSLLSLSLGALTVHATEKGDMAPDVAMDQIHADGSISTESILATDTGDKFVLIEFFSVTCQPCTQNLPGLSKLSKDLDANVTTRMISLDRKLSDVKNYIAKHSDAIKFSVGMDTSRVASDAYSIEYTPTNYLINKDHVVVYKSIGTMSSSELKKISDIVNKSTASVN